MSETQHQDPPPRPGRRRHLLHPAGMWRSLVVRPKVVAAILTALAVLALLPSEVGGYLRSAIAWDAGGLVYLALAVRVMQTCDSNKIRRRAAQQDDSAMVILILILTSIAASFLAIAGLLSDARAAEGADRAAYLALAGFTIFISWAVTQVVFTLHYAHEFYAPPAKQQDAEKGLIFPDDEKPDYWDFFYFASSIGAASQTSDVSIRSKSLRRLVTIHSVVSFFFNTMVLALTINLAASLV